jgi:N4-(beta-N-acetylglucosaminyl)-L-asparaginase
MSISRRDFIGAGAASAAGLLLPRPASGMPQPSDLGAAMPEAIISAGRPAVVSSANGIKGVKIAYDMIVGGADPLDAAIAGVNPIELDPTDQSVGLGGLPNADGVVQLDASVMHGPTKRAGSVAAIEDIATPSLVAKAVMDYTDEHQVVGVVRPPDARRCRRPPVRHRDGLHAAEPAHGKEPAGLVAVAREPQRRRRMARSHG